MKGFLKSVIVFILITEARLILLKHKPIVIAVTGSVGKTTTKDAIYSVLERKFFVRKSEKSFNSEIGVPLTILGLPNAWNSARGWFDNILRGASLLFSKKRYPKYLVLEVGADRPRDIERIAKWVKPHVAVVSQLPVVPVHVEYFKSPEAVADEKLSLVRFSREGSTAIYCFDDLKLRSRKEFSSRKTLSFGFESGAKVKASDDEIIYDEVGKPLGMKFKIIHGIEEATLTVRGVVGRQVIYSFLAAVSAGLTLGMTLVEATANLNERATPSGRMKIIAGLKSSVILDDTYNSSPVASTAALKTLASINTTGRKIVIFGDMLELGKYSVDEHKEIGRQSAFADRLVAVGVRARDFGIGARSAKMLVSKIKYFETAEEAIVYIKKDQKVGDTILVKGSQGMRMEKIVFALMADPKMAKELLVRQDEEWARR